MNLETMGVSKSGFFPTVLPPKSHKWSTKLVTSLPNKSVGVIQGLEYQIQKILCNVFIETFATSFNHTLKTPRTWITLINTVEPATQPPH